MNKGAMAHINKSGNRQKPRDVKYTLKRLWDYLYKFKWLLFLALALTIASNLFALIGPKLLGYAIDSMDDKWIENGKSVSGVNLKEVLYYCALMAIFYVLSSVFSFILARLMIYISKRIVFKMREDAFDKLMKLPVSYYDTNLLGDIISKMSYDIDTINTSLSSDIIHICTSLITVTGSLAMMISISAKKE